MPPLASLLATLAVAPLLLRRSAVLLGGGAAVLLKPACTRADDAGALAKLQRYGQELVQRGASRPEPIAWLVAIVNPVANLRGRGAGLTNLFSTHPPTQARIDRLLALQL